MSTNSDLAYEGREISCYRSIVWMWIAGHGHSSCLFERLVIYVSPELSPGSEAALPLGRELTRVVQEYLVSLSPRRSRETCHVGSYSCSETPYVGLQDDEADFMHWQVDIVQTQI